MPVIQNGGGGEGKGIRQAPIAGRSADVEQLRREQQQQGVQDAETSAQESPSPETPE